ncbi:MAG: DedA family protein [Terriglobales bacterium]
MALQFPLAAWDGYLVFFLWILGNRIGVPIPATPALLLAGALSGFGELRLGTVLLLAIVATVASDSVWFELGRRYGTRVLVLLCRLTFQSHTLVSRAKRLMHLHGMRSLLITKFIPGMNRTMLPLTGISERSFARFLMFDAVGAAIWATAYLGLGFLLREELESAVRYAKHAGWLLGTIAVLAGAGFYVFWRLVQRNRVGAEQVPD